MKIISVDNYDRETVDDVLVCENVSEYFGARIVRLLNEDEGRNGSRFFRLVPDDHTLRVWEP